MQIEQDGIVYEVVKVVEAKMTEEEKKLIISSDERELSELWDIYIDNSWSPTMKEILMRLQEDIEERRDFLEGEIAMLTEQNGF